MIHRLRRWAALTVRGFIADRGLEAAGSLAYVTLLSLVPLLATVAALYRSFFSAHTSAIVDMITVLLPYSSAAVAETLNEFVDRAATVGGIGTLLFVVIVFRLFFSIEETLNAVWGVAGRRSTTMRIFSFTMVLFWGPVVVGLGTTALIWFEHEVWVPSSAALLSFGRIALPLVGFTMVYWVVPHTSVRLRHALVGGVVATAGLQALRSGFTAYIRSFPNINVIFGSLALAVIFLMSLFAFWMIVLIGAQASYVAQNLHALARGPDEAEEPHPEPYATALTLLCEAYRRLFAGAAPAELDELVRQLDITHRYARSLLGCMVDAGLLAVTGQTREHYVPVRDGSGLTVGAALLVLRQQLEDPPPPVGERGPTQRLHALLEQAQESQYEVLTAVTFRDLVSPAPEPDAVTDARG